MHQLSIILLAAGLSSRMQGQDKLMMLVDGVPCLRRAADIALSICEQVIVALPPDFPARHNALTGLSLETLVIEQSPPEMSASLRESLSKVSPKACGVMILPADMPEIDAADLRIMQAAFQNNPDKIFRGSSVNGKAGHPVIFPRRLFGVLTQVTGDNGARTVIEAHSNDVCMVALPGFHALIDLDTPEEWTRWYETRSLSSHQ